MLVDTDPGVATHLMDDAAKIGIETTWCDDGVEALLAIGVEQPNVLVLAARTSVVDAARITSAVRNRWNLPILIGAPSADEVTRRALSAGASALIVRPYDINTIAPFAFNGIHDPGGIRRSTRRARSRWTGTATRPASAGATSS